MIITEENRPRADITPEELEAPKPGTTIIDRFNVVWLAPATFDNPSWTAIIVLPPSATIQGEKTTAANLLLRAPLRHCDVFVSEIKTREP